jgi:hypothetical protein
MNHMTSLFSRLLLALALATSAGATLAAPSSYHINLDTTAFAGDGNLDLTFIGNGNAGAATATISNFFGDVRGASELDGSVTGDLATSAVFDNASPGELAQLIRFGGVFGFDVLFDYAESGEGTLFGLSLYNADFTSYVGTEGALANFMIIPGLGIVSTAVSPFVTVSEIGANPVPEPGQWLLMATGLLLLGATIRRRSL